MAGQVSQAHLDHAAQQMGFPDYATWSAWNQQQQMMQNPSMQPGARPAAQAAPQQQAAPGNWLQQLVQQYTPLGGAMKRVGQVLR